MAHEPGPADDYMFVHRLLLAYLSLLHRDVGPHEWLVLDRSPDDGRPNCDPQRPSFLFDPRGGTFVFDPAARRDSFRWRTTVAMSPWDISQKVTARFWLERFREYIKRKH